MDTDHDDDGTTFSTRVPTNNQAVRAHTYLRKWPTSSKPAAMICDDGFEYVVKGCQVGRELVTDRLVALVGQVIGAPVGTPRLVEVPKELVNAEPELSHFTPGISHGTRLIPDCSDRRWIAFVDEPLNRARFASLATLYGLFHPADQQLIYSNVEPHLVYSVDHGRFLPVGLEWSVQTLQAGSTAAPYPELVNGCNLKQDEVSRAVRVLSNLTDNKIAQMLKSIPAAWGVTFAEQVELAGFLAERRDALFQGIFGSVAEGEMT